jgi:putative CocE/NonD family hydrolase
LVLSIVLVVWTTTPDPAATQSAPPAGSVGRDVAVRMRDGVILRADVWQPATAGRHPTLVYRTPYDKTSTSDGSLVRNAVARGYAVVVQDVRGRYASDGEYDAYRQEGKDGFDTIEWAAAQPWSNGRVGTFGLSYPGAVQWLAAIESPPHLVAMVPAMTFASPTHFWYSGGVWDATWLTWIWNNIAPDVRKRRHLAGPRTARDARDAWRTDGPGMLAFFPRAGLPALKGIADWYYEWMQHPPYDPWWDWAELTNKYQRVDAAVLNLSGWHDDMYGPIGATTNFAGLVAARGGDARQARTQVVIGPWTHGTDLSATRIGVREMGSAAALDYDELVLRWMDAWLKDLDNGVRREPPVRLYEMGAGAWHTGDAWPPAAERRSLYLAPPAGDRRHHTLQWEPPAEAGTASFVSDAAHPVQDPHNGQAGAFDYRSLSARDDVLTFETAPLAGDLDVVGPLQAEMFISTDRPDTDLWVKLLDVQPDGTAVNVVSTGLDAIRASYRDRSTQQRLLEAGRVYRLNLDTLMTANRFARGHRLRVVVMASFAPNLSRNLQTGRLEFFSADSARARISVHVGGASPSRLALPITRDSIPRPGEAASSATANSIR